MNNSLRFSLLGAAVSICCSVGAAGTPLHDPRSRDEDISATVIKATVHRLPDGIYEYQYDLTSPSTNKGRILTFSIDQYCTLDFGDVVYPEPPYRYFTRDLAPFAHVPIQPYAAVAEDGRILSGPPSVSLGSMLSWLLGLSPGKSVAGLRILSPAPPGERLYRLTPSMDVTDTAADGVGWDYESFQEDETLPWIHDFEVWGLITAPACAYVPPDKPPLYPGNGGEPDEVNALLSYETPRVDRKHEASDSSTLKLVVHYAPAIDPRTFKVEPAHLRKHFRPAPGTSETVIVPLERSKTRIKLEVHPRGDGGDQKDNDLDQSYKDSDTFEIRIDRDEATPTK